MKQMIYIILITVLGLTSCDILVNDITVTCVNDTNTTVTMVFYATDYPLPTINNIVTNNKVPILTWIDVPAKDNVSLTIYEVDRLGVWYGAYINDSLYVTGKVINPIIKIKKYG